MAALHIQQVFDAAEFFSRSIRKHNGSPTTGWWYGTAKGEFVGRVRDRSVGTMEVFAFKVEGDN